MIAKCEAHSRALSAPSRRNRCLSCLSWSDLSHNSFSFPLLKLSLSSLSPSIHCPSDGVTLHETVNIVAASHLSVKFNSSESMSTQLMLSLYQSILLHSNLSDIHCNWHFRSPFTIRSFFFPTSLPPSLPPFLIVSICLPSYLSDVDHDDRFPSRGRRERGKLRETKVFRSEQGNAWYSWYRVTWQHSAEADRLWYTYKVPPACKVLERKDFLYAR